MNQNSTTTIKRNLTEASQPVADDLVKRVGSIKVVLSAGVIALSKLTPAEREKMIIEANTDLPVDEMEHPENLHQAIKTVVQIISGTNKDIQILPDEYGQLEELVKKMFGPKEPTVIIKRRKA